MDLHAVAARRRAAATALVADAVALALGAACTRRVERDPSHALPGPPTEAQARALIAAKYEQAQARDRRAYCADTTAPRLCEQRWEHVGGDAAVPAVAPRIAGVRIDGSYAAVRACGTDGRGKPYSSDFLVQLTNGHPQAVLAVFWDDRHWSGSHWSGDEPTTASVPPDKGPPC